MEISTHTLTWSVTLATTVPSSDTEISTHTLTWSVTSQLAGLDVAKPISTHTLTWSVTSPPMIYRTYVRYFNSHAHVERD